jgi:uncharacterized protein YecE (DUF72 family)
LTFHIGTSGWAYNHWGGKFYPEELPKKEWFNYYKKHLDTVELNTTFYHLPKKSTFESWENNAPRGFIYAIKASRYITHIKKLDDPEPSVKKLFDSVEGMTSKAGPILFQLPPGWKYNSERLAYFLNVLPKNYKYAFEFRNETWWNDEALSLLKKYNAAFCMFELAGVVTPRHLTADFAYIRLHGPGNKYKGSYSDETLEQWAGYFFSWNKTLKKIFCYFDNDDSAFAVFNAIKLNEIIKQKAKEYD